jgi:hypothetical protein
MFDKVPLDRRQKLFLGVGAERDRHVSKGVATGRTHLVQRRRSASPCESRSL